MTNIYINIAITGSVNQVLTELLDKIEVSGLYDHCDKIFLVINGDKNLLNFEMKSKYVIYNPHKDISHCEFPTLDLMWTHSQKNDNIKMLYLHTKGVTKPNHSGVRDWTEYLTFFNVERWQHRVAELENYDVTGVNYGGNPEDYKEDPLTWGHGKAPLHFSGNFWWSKSSHIKTLKNPYDYVKNDNYMRYRVACEMWVCSNLDAYNEGKYYGAWHSNVNHYTTLYPREKYEPFAHYTH